MKIWRVVTKLILAAVFILVVGLFTSNQTFAATNGRLIDDAIWDNSSSMSAADIQNFLNQFPSSCIKDYTDAYPESYWTYGGAVSAATIIRRASDYWGFNPQAILAKLQQEQSLVTGGAGCASWRYTGAMGFNCPDGQSCPVNAANAGFSRQVMRASWLLKITKERAIGNFSWEDPADNDWYYGGPMTQGVRKRCGTCAAVYFDGYWNGIYLETGATAALYNYTPHVPSSFDDIFEGWWGTTYANVIGAQAYSLYNPYTKDHFYTAREGDRYWVKKYAGFFDDKIAFNVKPTQEAGTLPVYSMYNGRIRDHFYTFDGLERYWALIFGGYKDDGVFFYAYPSQEAGTIPVYQLWNGGHGDHFYTKSDADKVWVQLHAGYIYNKVAFYVPQ